MTLQAAGGPVSLWEGSGFRGSPAWPGVGSGRAWETDREKGKHSLHVGCRTKPPVRAQRGPEQGQGRGGDGAPGLSQCGTLQTCPLGDVGTTVPLPHSPVVLGAVSPGLSCLCVSPREAWPCYTCVSCIWHKAGANKR